MNIVDSKKTAAIIFKNLKWIDAIHLSWSESPENLTEASAELVASCINTMSEAVGQKRRVKASDILEKPKGLKKLFSHKNDPWKIALRFAIMLGKLDEENILPGDVVDEVQASESYHYIVLEGKAAAPPYVNLHMYFVALCLARNRGLPTP